MKSKVNECKSCSACKRIYRLGVYSFWKWTKFYCTAFDKLTESDGFCDCWQKRKKTEYDLSAQRFDEAAQDVKLIAEYMADK